MPFKSRWQLEIPNAHLATVLFTSPTHELSKTHRCFSDAERPDTHYLTTHDFRLWSQRLAAGLRASGIRTGDRILLFSGNDLLFPVVYMGIIMAGAIFTAANPAYVERELAYQLKDSGAKYLLCARKSLKTGVGAAKQAGLSLEQVFVFDSLVYDVEERGSPQKIPDNEGRRYWGELIASKEEGRAFAWDELSTPELATRIIALNYSSGTTGVPKGVEITHKNQIANSLQWNHLFYLQPDHKARSARARWLCFLPLYHGMAQNLYIFQALNRGVPVYIVPKYNFLKMLEYIERFRITDLIIVPPIAITLAKHPAARSGKYDLSSVETIFSGAAPLGREVCEDVERIWDGKVNVKQGWGMTETTSCVLNWDPRQWSNSACVGELLANCEAKIMADDEVTELGYNQRGELWVRGQNIMRGYWQKPDATKGTFSSDGWLKTGDIAYVDNQQKFFVVDRKKELIKVKGNQVAPAELEGLLLEHPSVVDAAVIGVPMDEDERPRAYIVVKPGCSVTAQEIAEYMDSRVAHIKRLKGGIIFVPAIPKNPSGKILRNELRKQAKVEMSTGANQHAKL